jgi:NAD+ synthase (glutamine-hydrolysing)
MRIALAQMNPTVGDVAGNTKLIVEAIDRARQAGAQVVALPELAVTGYPPEDLLFKKSFIRRNYEALNEIAASSGELLVLVGLVDQKEDRLYNAAAICHKGEVLAIYHKQLLPNYGVFDERRYFTEGSNHTLIETNAGVIGVCVCEDVWFSDGPAEVQGRAGAQIVFCLNASPFHKGRLTERAEVLAERARATSATMVYLNTVGGQDELVFDGGSLVVGEDGKTIARFPQFEEHFDVFDVEVGSAKTPERRADIEVLQAELPEVTDDREPSICDEISGQKEIYDALVLALRDYARKNGFEKIVVGISGGIDSTLTAVLAADAIGSDSVLGVAMPSDFSTSHSLSDARELASNLGIELEEIPIAGIYGSYVEAMKHGFGEAEAGLAEENFQARARGNLLMAISNRYGHLVVATGNKSEMACGYATLYGDMAGGFALLRDVFKTEVYELCEYRNSVSHVIPQNVIEKPPSAELRPDQKDEDSLPPYRVLDPILEAYIERDSDVEDIVAAGHDEETAREVIRLVDRAEYKRRQAPPGPKVTTKAFGRDRRLPITNAWRT